LGPSIRRTTALLAAAALIVATFGLTILLAGNRSPSIPNPTSAAVIAPSPVASPTDPPVPCERMAALVPATDADGGGQVQAAVEPSSENADIVLVASHPGTESSDLARFDPGVGAASLRFLTDWRLDDLPVTQIVPSPDGTLIAVELRFPGPDACTDIVVLAIDGSSLRRPFAAAHGEGYYGGPRWSPDGRLAAFHSHIVEQPSGPSVGASLVVWDPATGDVRDLGSPCQTCGDLGPPASWSPDGSRLAVAFDSGPPAAPRSGVAVSDGNCCWTTYSGWAVDAMPPYVVIGWSDQTSALVTYQFEASVGDVRWHTDRLDATSGKFSRVVHGDGNGDPWRLSPDRSSVFGLGISEGRTSMEIMRLADGHRVPIEPPLADVLDVTWSPDSQWIAFQAGSLDSNDRGIFVAPANGDTSPRRILSGAYGVMGWLPAPDPSAP
jgi:hypothetical protein